MDFLMFRQAQHEGFVSITHHLNKAKAPYAHAPNSLDSFNPCP